MKCGSGACDAPRFNARRFEEMVVGKIRSNVLTESNIGALVKVVDEEMEAWLLSSVSPGEAGELLAAYPGVVVDDPSANAYPRPIDGAGKGPRVRMPHPRGRRAPERPLSGSPWTISASVPRPNPSISPKR